MSREVPIPPVVVLGASAGGVETLRTVVGGLPADLAAAVLVVLHVSAAGTSVLPAILARCTTLPVRAAQDGEQLRPGVVLVAVPDRHLELTEAGAVSLRFGPKENGHRPAIDTTMRSVAARAGPRGTGVVLSGTRDDGAGGLAAIQAAGGRTLVQVPADALYPGMPESALAAVTPDAVMPAAELGAAIGAPSSSRLPWRPAAVAPVLGDVPARPGSHPTRFTCPDCDGVLFTVSENGVERFRCSVGHAYSAASLEAEHAARMEHALWAAVRSLEDRAVLLDRLGAHTAKGQPRSAAGFHERAQRHRDDAELLRATLGFPPPSTGAPPQSPEGGDHDVA